MNGGKRLFDLVCASTGLALLSPLFLCIAAVIYLEDSRPVFFRQWRVGRYGRPFRMWKFRTMVVDADRQGRQITVGRDPRITRIGHWLRRFKLDELPQLLNVMTGEMSLVGPRPEVQRYVDLYTPAQRTVLDLVPGITDPASIAYRNESELLANAEDPERYYIDKIMPEKIRINLEYAARRSFWSDLVIVLRTVLPFGD